MRTNELISTAKNYKELGFSVVPINTKSKNPCIKWQDYQERLPEDKAIESWVNLTNFDGLAIVAGNVSGNIECLDFDLKNADSTEFFYEMMVEVSELLNDYDKMTIQSTQNNGYHWIYRTESSQDKNEVLAYSDNGKPIIETRTNKSLFIAYPSPGYQIEQGSLDEIITINSEDRDNIFKIARKYNQKMPGLAPINYFNANTHHQSDSRPGDEYNNSVSIADIKKLLESHHWMQVAQNTKSSYWRRPGKEIGISATLFESPDIIFYVFSNSTNLPSETGLTPFALITYFEFNGDFSASAKSLVKNSKVSANTDDNKLINKFGLTEQSNSDRFVHHYGDKVKYNFTNSKWYLWNGKVWAISEKGEIIEICKKVVKFIKDEANPLEQYEKEKLLKFYNKCLKYSAYNNIAEISKSHKKISAVMTDFDTNPALFNLQNGIFFLDSFEFKPHDQYYMITKIAEYSYLPDAKCPLWEEFLNEIFCNNQDLILFVQKLVGYSLTGFADLQKVMFCYGSGANGKSVFFGVLGLLLGDYFQKSPLELVMLNSSNNSATPDVARLAGVRLTVLQEVPEGKRVNESRLKDLSGGDKITARHLFKEYFDFTPQCKIWLYGNHKPRISGTDEGIWRRIIMLPFLYTVPSEKRRPMSEMMNEFKAEISGIFNWAIIGLKHYLMEGLNEPLIVLEAMQGYRSEMDMLGYFLTECTIIQDNLKVKQMSLYENFSSWCEQLGEKPMSARSFSQKMKERGFINQRGSGGTYEWIGLDILESGKELLN